MEFRILGPLEVERDGRILPLGTGRQLALVAVLLLHRNEIVSIDGLVDELWEGEPPPTAAKIVRNNVSLLRKELGDRLVTRPPGYLLRVEPGELDSRPARECRRARAGSTTSRPRSRSGAARRSSNSHTSASPRREIARLEELRLAALEAQIEAELARGRHAAWFQSSRGSPRSTRSASACRGS